MYDTKGFKGVKFIITGILFLLTLTLGTIAKCATFFIVVHLNPMLNNLTKCVERNETEELSITQFNSQNNFTAWLWYERKRNITL